MGRELMEKAEEYQQEKIYIKRPEGSGREGQWNGRSGAKRHRGMR